MANENTQGLKAEQWVKEFAQGYRILNTKAFSLEKVLPILNNQLQYKLLKARPHLSSEFPFANEWIDAILSNKQALGDAQEKSGLAAKLLDSCLATDLILRLKDNNSKEQVVAIDVTANPEKEQEKLNTIRGKRDKDDHPNFNRNANLTDVRRVLGITKHLILVINPDNPPADEQLLNTIYTFANQPAKTGSINLYSNVPQSALTEQISSPPQSALEVPLDPNLAKVLSLIEQLPEKELTNTVQRVQNYFASMPPSPPTQVEQLAVQEEIKSLLAKIPTLWQRQERQANNVSSMRKDPLRAWNKKHDAALGELQQTMKLIKETIRQKEQKESQLHDWAQTHKVYQAWLSDPQTKQMQDVAAVLKMPQIQKRVNQIRQKAIGQQQQTKVEPKQQRSRPNPKRDQGLSL